MLRNDTGLTAQDGAETVGCRDIVSLSNLIAFSAKDADRDATKAAANQERRAIASAHEFCLITSCTRRTATKIEIDKYVKRSYKAA